MSLKKISTFRGKWSYLEITLRKSFLPIYTKISTFRGKGSYFEISLKKSWFAIFGENIRIQGKVTESLWKNVLFVHIFENINISRKRKLFWDLIWEIVVCHFRRKYKNSRKRYWISLKKSFFAHIFENINISRKINHFEEVVFAHV